MSSMQELEDASERLLNSPAGRARLLADTLELFERAGADLSSPHLSGLLTTNVADRGVFLGNLAASTVVIVAASAGQRGFDPSTVASSVVIVAATAGQRALDPSTRASSVVIVAATAGQRALDPSTAASTVVIVAASAGQRGALLQLNSVDKIESVSAGLRALADQLDAGKVELSQELAAGFKQYNELAPGDGAAE
jgi:hypothetical protein